MRRAAAITSCLLGVATLGLLTVWIGRIYYFAGSLPETVAQLRLLGNSALLMAGGLAVLTFIFIACGVGLLSVREGSSRSG